MDARRIFLACCGVLAAAACAEAFLPDVDLAGCLRGCNKQMPKCLDDATICAEACGEDNNLCQIECARQQTDCVGKALDCTADCVQEFQDEL